MDIDDFSFHDSTILEIREFPENQILELLLDFPVDWENNLFEHRILKFNEVINYKLSSIPFRGSPAILEINKLGVVKYEFGSGRNAINAERNKIEIITNAGKRTIEYTTCEMMKPPNL